MHGRWYQVKTHGRKIAPKIKFPTSIFVHFHEKEWMDENGVRLWVENVWQR